MLARFHVSRGRDQKQQEETPKWFPLPWFRFLLILYIMGNGKRAAFSLIQKSGNLSLSKDHRGWFILRYRDQAGIHTVHLAFPPHAFAQASVSFDNALLYFQQINDRPAQRIKTQIMIGHQVAISEPSRAPRAKRGKCSMKNR